MPILPNFVERSIVFALNQAPGPLIDMWSAAGFRIALAALRLGVYDALDAGPLSPDELARRVKTDARGTAMLLDTLEALGYVRKQSGRYANTAMTTKWLTSNSPSSFAAFFRYWGALLSDRWDDLEDSIRNGKPAVNLYEWIEHQPDVSRDFQIGMIGIARFAADEIIGKLKVPPAARVLDVGGGHAAYSIAVCRKYPQASATVFDSPQALKTGRDNIVAEKMEGRITVREGDFLHDDLGSNYDVALVFNIIHGFSPEDNTALSGRVAQALKPGGQIVVLEQLAGSAPLPMVKAISRILGMSYFHLLGGQVYAFEDVARWLKAAGFRDVRRINLLKSAGNSLVIGTRIT